jgi:hypothetical protein
VGFFNEGVPSRSDEPGEPFGVHCVLRATQSDDAYLGRGSGGQVRLFRSCGSVIVVAEGPP